jgi:hypothetical protein
MSAFALYLSHLGKKKDSGFFFRRGYLGEYSYLRGKKYQQDGGNNAL